MNLNDVKVVGNLVKSPELRRTPGGTAVANVHIGINERYKVDNTMKETTTFTEVQVWGPAAENLSKMAKKGQEILVEGSLRQDNWEDKETGASRSKLYINAERWQFTQRKGVETVREEHPEPAVR